MSKDRQTTTLIVLDTLCDPALLQRISTSKVKLVRAGADIKGYGFDKILTCLTPLTSPRRPGCASYNSEGDASHQPMPKSPD